MDSLTQITLGAAVGEAVLGKKIGNKAILWGAIAGTIPDLDVLFIASMDPIQELTVHRGISHSFVFAILASPLIALLPWKIHQKSTATWKNWTILFFLGIFTHIILDSLTHYGTQVFLPFSDYRLAFNSVFVVDPFYTVPFLISVIACLFLKRDSSKRRLVNWIGISVSSLYLFLGLAFKSYSKEVFKRSLETQQIEYQRMATGCTPLNIFLWYTVAETENGYYIGYYSLFDEDENIHFSFYQQNDHLLQGIKNTYAVDRLIWFSKGFYLADEVKGELRFYTLKFGKSKFEGEEPENSFSFYFVIEKLPGGEVKIIPRRGFDSIDYGKAIHDLWRRIRGDRSVMN